MNWDELFDKLIKEIAVELKLGFSKTRGGYLLAKDKNKLIGISYFVGRNGKLKVLMSPGASGRPIDLGDYKMEELQGKNSKARKAIIANLIEQIGK